MTGSTTICVSVYYIIIMYTVYYTQITKLDLCVDSHYARVKFYFLNDVIEREREVKQVQISRCLCLVPFYFW